MRGLPPGIRDPRIGKSRDEPRSRTPMNMALRQSLRMASSIENQPLQFHLPTLVAAPLTPRVIRSMAEIKAEQSHIGQCMRILVVEDDTFVREAMRMMIETIEKESAAMYAKQELALRPTKLQAEYTMTGEQGWDMLRSRRFDIALIDLNLPGVSGLDLSWSGSRISNLRAPCVDSF